MRCLTPGRRAHFVGFTFLFALSLAHSAGAATATVSAGGDIQAAVDAANCGDVIVLQAGATYTGPVILRNKAVCAGTDADTITIVTSNLGGISADGQRINPALHASAMPKIVGGAYATIQTEARAHRYKLIGIEITTNGASYTPDLLQIGATGSGAGGYPTRDELFNTHHFTIDRCFIHPPEINGTQLTSASQTRSAGRGVLLHGVELSVTNSYIAGFEGYFPGTSSSIDSYGIYSVVGPGPLHITNNYIEAQFNNVFIGGGDPPSANTASVSAGASTVQAVLSNVNNLNVNDLIAFKSGGGWGTVRVTGIAGNSVSYTPYGPSALTSNPDAGGVAQWNGDLPTNISITANTLEKLAPFGAQNKSWIEIKVGKNVLIDGNRMIGEPIHATTLALTARNQGGSAPWARLEDVTVSNNHITGWGQFAGMQLTDNEKTSSASRNISFVNNLLDAPGNFSYGRLFDTEGPGDNISVRHNTFINTNTTNIVAGAGSGPTTGLVFKDNIVFYGPYGLSCFMSPSETQTCWPNLAESNNVVVDSTGAGAGANFPHSAIVSSTGSVGFVNAAGGDYRLAAGSAYRNAASDGTDIGVNFNTLNAAMAGQTTSNAPSVPSNVRIVQTQ